MQRISPVDQHPVKSGFLARNLLVEGRVSVDVRGFRPVRTGAFALYAAEVLRPAGVVNDFVAGGAMAIESRAAQVRLEKIVDDGEFAVRRRVDVRDSLQLVQVCMVAGHQRELADGEAQYRGDPEELAEQRAELFEDGLLVAEWCLGANAGIVGRDVRSEERRVGKECRSRWWPYR